MLQSERIGSSLWHSVADGHTDRMGLLLLLCCDEGSQVGCSRMQCIQESDSPAGLPRQSLPFHPETQLWISFPLPECVGVGLNGGGEHHCTLSGDNHHLLCFCSVQNKLLSKGLSLTHPPASSSCLPSPDPAAASSPSTVDSVSPARKVAVLNN